jgi:hypothetical protein
MNRIRRVRRLAAAAVLAGALLAVAAPRRHWTGPVFKVPAHTVVPAACPAGRSR